MKAKVRSLRMILSVSLLLIAGLSFWGHGHASQNQTSAVLLTIKGAIGPAIADYLERGIEHADQQKAHLVIIQMDTPGGLATSMRSIIKSILNSPLPVVAYVAPRGARAASAGTYILYASHIAAMAPGTNLGAATPVAIGMPGSSSSKKDGETTEDTQTAMERKATSDASAYIRSLAQLRGRNVKWAEEAVRKAESLSADEALKKNVIDIVAKDNADLLAQINGRTVQVNGNPYKITSDNLVINEIKPDWRARFLAVITDPSVAYMLMLVGIYGLFIEFTNPGFILPGVTGAISILLALYAFQLLPINYVGLALIILGIAFMVSEAFVSSFGALGIGGVIAFVVGSVMLMDTKVPGFTIALPLIITVAIASAGLFLLVANLAVRAQRRQIVTGREEILHSDGIVVAVEGDIIRVRIRGELWQAMSPQPLSPGQKVTVKSMEGLMLTVEPTD